MRYIHIDRSLPLVHADYQFYNTGFLSVRVEFDLGEYKKAFLLIRPSVRRGIVFPISFIDQSGDRSMVYSEEFVGLKDDWLERRLTKTN